MVSRGDTSLVDAYLGPVIRGYVDSIAEAAPSASLRLLTSAGGLCSPRLFRGKDAGLSGPAGGGVGSAQVAREAGCSCAIAFDMGGTSLDLGIVVDGEARRTNEYLIEWGTPVRFPSIDVFSIGAGGGSIAWIDDFGKMHVGPRSAGANPGPAAYGRGGDTMLACPGLCDDALLTHTLAKEALTQSVVDLVCPCVGKVFALEIQASSAYLFREVLGEVDRRWSTCVGAGKVG